MSKNEGGDDYTLVIGDNQSCSGTGNAAMRILSNTSVDPIDRQS